MSKTENNPENSSGFEQFSHEQLPLSSLNDFQHKYFIKIFEDKCVQIRNGYAYGDFKGGSANSETPLPLNPHGDL